MIIITPFQRDFLQHRLDVPDCICEVLTEEHGYTIDAVLDSIDFIQRCVKNRVLKLNNFENVDNAVLYDLLNGSTWFAANVNAMNCGEMSHQQNAAQIQSIELLLKKLGAHGFEAVDVPYS